MPQLPGPRIYLVAAVAANGIIGVNGQLPWRLPEDLQHFKRLMMGHPILMGRKTWESLKGPLPGRDNIVISRQPGYEAPGAAVANSLEAALALCLSEAVVFVIGGAGLFAESLPIAAGLVMTEIHRDYEGDTWFPTYDRSRWKESQREGHTAKDGTKFDFVLYEPLGASANPT